MNRLRQYCPNSTPTTINSTAFKSTDELLAIPWVDSWRTRPDFHRFSRNGRLLVAELEHGTKWRVVGFLRDSTNINLPEFHKPLYKPHRNRSPNATADP